MKHDESDVPLWKSILFIIIIIGAFALVGTLECNDAIASGKAVHYPGLLG